jgi:HSP20 family molecular chaperone IbpA
MTDSETKEIQVKPKQEVASPAEQTKPGMVFTPSVDIFETDRELTLLADLPGVTAENLTIDLLRTD